MAPGKMGAVPPGESSFSGSKAHGSGREPTIPEDKFLIDIEIENQEVVNA